MHCNKYRLTSHIRSACQKQSWPKLGNWGKGLENCFRGWRNRGITAWEWRISQRTWQSLDKQGGTPSCPPQEHNSCAIILSFHPQCRNCSISFCDNAYAAMSLLKTVRGSKATATKITNSWEVNLLNFNRNFWNLFAASSWIIVIRKTQENIIQTQTRGLQTGNSGTRKERVIVCIIDICDTRVCPLQQMLLTSTLAF